MIEEMKRKIEGTSKDNQELLTEKAHILQQANEQALKASIFYHVYQFRA